MSFVAFIEFPRKVTSSDDNQLTDHINFAKNCYKTMFDKNRNESYTLKTLKKNFAKFTVFWALDSCANDFTNLIRPFFFWSVILLAMA